MPYEVSEFPATLTFKLEKRRSGIIKEKIFNALPTELYASLARKVGLEPTTSRLTDDEILLSVTLTFKLEKTENGIVE